MYIFKPCLVTAIVVLQCWTLHACGIAVHNEVTYRSLENFIPRTEIQQTYKNDILESASYSQAGSFFPDWGYQCLGYNQQSEDAHWPTFIKTAVNYIRQVYPISDFHSNPHVKGLISFVFAIMSHGMADVKWHSLGGLSDYFIVAMAKSDFHGETKASHLAADAGAEFTLRHSSKLAYLNETWQVPIKDIIEIYTRLYASDEEKAKKKRIPLASHIQYCMTAAFAASKIDVELGQFMFGYYGSKSPFLTEELYDYYKGGIEDMSAGVSDCYAEVINAFEQGTTHTHPDIMCANYFYASISSIGNRRCATQRMKPLIQARNIPSGRIVYKQYNSNTGVLTLTTTMLDKEEGRHDDTLLPVVVISQASSHFSVPQMQQQQRFQYQTRQQQQISSTRRRKQDKCVSLGENEDEISSVTLTIPMSSARVGHQIATGDFYGNGEMYMAISAPFHYNAQTEVQTGTVFILNQRNLETSLSEDTTSDIRDVSKLILQGDVPRGRFGWSMTSIDINQDGIDDLAISTLTNKAPPSKIGIYCGQAHVGLDNQPRIQIQLTSRELLASFLAAIDMNQDGYKDLVIGCSLCSVGKQPQVGTVYIFNSHQGACDNNSTWTNPDIQIDNPNVAEYDHFGESILRVQDTLLIGAPGFSVDKKQRVGRVYAFDIPTQQLKWTMTGTNEFQQFGKVIATDEKNEIVAISSPSEETTVGLQKFWQGGTVRIYNWNELQTNEVEDVSDFDTEHGMMSVIKGRTNAGHLGQSISFFENDLEKGIWVGEPMSERENGRVYRWQFGDEDNNIECIRNNQVMLARFGSQIGSLLGTDAICITSQRYGQNARYSGAVTFLQLAR